MNKFQDAQKRIVNAATEAAEVAKQNMQNMYENATKIKMDIDLDAPDIILPRNSRGYHAIVLSMGNLKISNNFLNIDVENETGTHAVIDDMKLVLKDFRLLVTYLNSDYEFQYENTVVHPLTFILWVKRNLSSSWYTTIPDIDIIAEIESIELHLTQVDYLRMLRVLNDNLSEGVPLSPKKSVANSEKIEIQTVKTEESKKTSIAVKPNVDGPIHTFLKFSFSMNNFVIYLYTVDGLDSLSDLLANILATDTRSLATGLSKFTLHIFSLKGSVFTDGSIVTSLLLVDCLVDDLRPIREGKITRMMERKIITEEDEKESRIMSQDALKSMIDITYRQKDAEMFIDVRVYSFNFIISMEYFMKIAGFFSNPKVETELQAVDHQKAPRGSKSKSNVSQSSIKTKTPEPESIKTISFNLRIEKPDIILVDNMNHIDVPAFILHTEMTTHIKIAPTFQTYRIIVNNLQLYTSVYNPLRRNEKKCSVLQPCNFTVTGATPESKGLHFEILLTPLKLRVTPQTIDLMNRVLAAMNTSQTSNTDNDEEEENYTNVWIPGQFTDDDHWFLKAELAEDAYESPSLSGKSSDIQLEVDELAIINAPSLIITLETGTGKDTLPMLLLESSFEAEVRHWSTNMNINSTLTVQMAYYNNELALWEPLIEPVEVVTIGIDNEKRWAPWELKFEMQMNKDDYFDMPDASSPDGSNDFKITPKVSVNVSSKENLEIVITRTCMEVITQLGKAFQAAMTEGVSEKEEAFSPYRLINETGLKITLKLSESDFIYYNEDEKKNDINEIIVESGGIVPLALESGGLKNLNLDSSEMHVASAHRIDGIAHKYLVVYVSVIY